MGWKGWKLEDRNDNTNVFVCACVTGCVWDRVEKWVIIQYVCVELTSIVLSPRVAAVCIFCVSRAHICMRA